MFPPSSLVSEDTLLYFAGYTLLQCAGFPNLQCADREDGHSKSPCIVDAGGQIMQVAGVATNVYMRACILK